MDALPKQNEIIERAANAVGSVMYKRRNGGILLPWDIHPYRDEAIAYVRAVIEAIHEPTDEMVGYAFRIADAPIRGDDIKDAYKAMIEFALR